MRHSRRPTRTVLASGLASCLVLLGLLGGGIVDVQQAAAAPAQWVTTASPNHGGNQGDFLSGVSCVSSNDCVAVGEHSSLHNRRAKPLIESWNGRAWSITPSPYPTAVTNILQGVSCSSATACTAVGYDESTTVDEPLIESWNGSVWSVSPSPSPGNIQNELRSVSCVTANFCMAVGFYETQGSGSNQPQTLTEVWDGTTWSIVPSPDGSTGYNLLSSISCTGVNSCIATGYDDNSVAFQTLIESWDGSSWSIVPSPDQSNGGATANNFLEGVSCTGASSCMAAGFYYMNQYQDGRSLMESWDGTSWTIDPSPNQGTGYNDVGAVSCTGSSNCVAVGSSNDTPSGTPSANETLIESWDGTSWTLTPSPSLHSTDNGLAAVSCSGPSTCSAVGTHTNAAGLFRTLVFSGT